MPELIINNFDKLIFPLLVGCLLALTASVLGVVLVLKRYSMIGDGLSHVTFGVFAIALGIDFIDPDLSMFIVIPIVMVAAYFLLRLGESQKIKGDAAIGLISSAFLAIGYLVGSQTGFTRDIQSYMFGSIAFAGLDELIIIAPISIIVIVSFIFLYNRIFAVTFDESFAKAIGIKTKVYNMIFAFFTAVVIVVGIKIMGSLLISSIIILPALSAMQVFTKFKKVMIASAVMSVTCFIIAFFVFIEYSSGASVVIVNLFCFIVCAIIGAIRRKLAR